ncbi:MAG: methylated-DNA--[protein]-cysteine S-methyltransferase [Dehalococcoidales bacterium]|nr:methylated-DNA--[protein]-cysteine S-methyltransferase [Dehalococcoidales bacterium]
MTSKLNYTVFNTAAGWIGIMASHAGLLALTFPRPSPEQAVKELDIDPAQSTNAPQVFEDLAERFRIYFRGRRVNFPDKLDLSAATPFQHRVWQATRLIPFGETRSYRWVAEQIGIADASRAVGQALGRNPLPVIIPCHRVLTSNGKLGGFSGGLDMKERLLALEKKQGG